MDFLEDFKQLNENRVYSIIRLEWWLLKYSDEYKKTNEFAKCPNYIERTDDLIAELPTLKELNFVNTFLDLYRAIDEISKFHRNENYFEQEVLDYYTIRNSDSHVKKWISKNEFVGADVYVCFLTDYLDYDENDNEEHLKVYVPSLNDFEIYINRADFKYTINFLEIFNDNYWK